MGCRPCKSGKAFMPVISQIDDHLVRDFTSILSGNNPNASYPTLSNLAQLHDEPLQANFSSSPHEQSDRSYESVHGLTASTEFKRMSQRSSDTSNSLQKEYKIYVWTTNRKVFRNIFPQSSFNEAVELNGCKFEANFSIYTSCTPIVIDCVVYLLEKVEDFKEIYKVNQQFKHVWVQSLFTLVDHKSIFEVAESLGIQILKCTKKLYEKIIAEDLRLNCMLKDIFKTIDDNNNGEIDFDELAKAFQSISGDIQIQELKEGLKKIDFDRDGKISFEEFCFWWKKGRQGPLNFGESALRWAQSISVSSPETKLLLRKMAQNRTKIDKKLKKKEILIHVGQEFRANTTIKLEIGKSSTREKILNEVNTKLSLFSQEVWLCLHSKVSSFNTIKNIDKQTDLIKKQASILLESFTNNFIDGRRLRESIESNVHLHNSDFYLSFSLDTENIYMDPLSKLLSTIDELFTSPTNDSISINFESDSFFYQLFNKSSLFTNLGQNTKTSLTIDHWSKYFSVFSSIWPELFKQKLIFGSLLIGNSRIKLDYAKMDDVHKSLFNSNTKIPDLSELLTPGFLHFLNKISFLFTDDLVVFARCGNIGMSIKIHSNEVIAKILQHNNN